MMARLNSYSTEKLRIIILGYIIRGPLGGLVWHHLQYVIGLIKLGHDVVFIEDSDDFPSCYNPLTSVTNEDPSFGLSFAESVFSRLGIADCWAYHDAHTHQWFGPFASQIHAFISSADVLIDVSGVNPIRPWFMAIPVRVLIDTDPVFTQIRHLTDDNEHRRAAQHTHFFSFGENIGLPCCSVPEDDFCWKPTRQPIVLDLWPVVPLDADAPFTTVMQWDSYKERSFRGIQYGMKSTSFTPYTHLPNQSGFTLELALGSPSAPRAMLLGSGWKLRDPLAVTQTPWSYQAYIAASKAEFSIAKDGYVRSYCGWFSERSACYLASGRPVLVQETGFSRWLPTGRGVLNYETLEQAIDGLKLINSNLAKHGHSAREIASEYFDYSKILRNLLERLE